MKLTQEVVTRCQSIQFPALSSEEKDWVKYLLLDFIAVAARGSLYESGIQAQQCARMLSQNGDIAFPIIGTEFKADPSSAALAVGTAAHSLELDDVTNEASLHAGVTVFSAALTASAFGRGSTSDFFEAVIAGYELTSRLGMAVNPAEHYRRGFHPTGTCGVFGAALAAAKMLGADEKQLLYALGIAGSQASGSMEFLSEGAFTKRFNAGWAAHSGVIAAVLASQGFIGPRTSIEGRYGFLNAYSPAPLPDKLAELWGSPYMITRTSIKPHACCRYKQGPIDGILKIMSENNLQAQDIKKVTLGVLEAGFPLVAEPIEAKKLPKTIVEAQFSMPFGAAVAMAHGKASLDQYTDQNLSDPEIKDLMERVECVKDPEIEKDFPKKWPASVQISTKQGLFYTVRIDYPKGDPENPLSWSELEDKFHELLKPVYSDKQRLAIINNVRGLDKDKNLDRFIMLLCKQ
ncbi:MAG: MmgE/PrpD family protein [Desulfovermiculus sp.]|nr:MmgE/PrpD family protein [Desulfovermiculus sp.]